MSDFRRCRCGTVFLKSEADGPSSCLAENVNEKRAGRDANGMPRVIPASEIAECQHPDAYLIGESETAVRILRLYPNDDGERERAMWRLFDSTIRLAEKLDQSSVTSGLADRLGWTMRKRRSAKRCKSAT